MNKLYCGGNFGFDYKTSGYKEKAAEDYRAVLLDGAAYPFWGWYRYSSLMVKPDLRQGGHAPRGTSCICVELELPEDSVLLSNFDSWGCILSGYPVLPEEEWDRYYDEFKALPPEEQQKVKLQTWEKIFSEFDDSPIQGVFWKLEMANVRNARFFKAK